MADIAPVAAPSAAEEMPPAAETEEAAAETAAEAEAAPAVEAAETEEEAAAEEMEKVAIKMQSSWRGFRRRRSRAMNLFMNFKTMFLISYRGTIRSALQKPAHKKRPEDVPVKILHRTPFLD